MALSWLPAALSVHAQERNLRFDRLSIEDGLSQSAVNVVFQDRIGFLWVGTEDGLNRYDGTRFEVFKPDPDQPASLSNSWIWAICEDRAGDLWIGTNGGLNRFDHRHRSFRVFRNDASDPGSLSHDRVFALLPSRDGSLWVGTDGGLNRYDPGTGSFTHYRHDPTDPQSLSHDRVRALHQDAEGGLWVGTMGGLSYLAPGAQEFRVYRQDPARTDDPEHLCDDKVRALETDSEGQVWIGSVDCGVSRLDPDTGRLVHLRPDPARPDWLGAGRVRALLEDDRGTLWVGTVGGLYARRAGGQGFTRYLHHDADPRSLGDDSVTALFQDRGGVLWAGTQQGGLSRSNIHTGSFPLFRQAEPGSANGLSNPVVSSFAEGKDSELWVGTMGGGLDHLDRKRRSFVYLRHQPAAPNSLADDRVMSLLLDSRQRLWVGTYDGGLDRLDPGANRFVHHRHDPKDPESLSDNGITTLHEDRNGALWIGTFRGGLNRLDPAAERFVRYPFESDRPDSLGHRSVTCILEDAEGGLWLGTHGGGLCLLDRRTSTFTRYRHDPHDPESLGHPTVMALAEGHDGTLWVGTMGGLNRWSARDRAEGRPRFKRYTERHGLPNNWVYGILEDEKGFLWLSTNQGLARFDPGHESFTRYGLSHGLQSNEFNFGAHYRSSSGEMFFGGISGFNAFFPEQIHGNRHVPPVVLTSFLKFGRPVELEGPVYDLRQVELSYRDYAVAFEFAALDYTNPAENRYSHKLEGFDREWTELGTGRRATYTNLPAGRYLLRVRASNNDGVWNQDGLSVAVRVSPAPWRTWWAYGLYALILGGAVLAYTRVQARRLEREAEYSRKLEQEVRERTRELEEATLTDTLTGLRNRRYLMTQVQEDIALTSRRLRRAAETSGAGPVDVDSYLFLMIDLDGLKPLNDVYGHAAGDRVLIQMRDLLSFACRKSDTLIRWGGDEFLVVGRDVDRRFAETVAERIRKSVSDHDFDLGEGQRIRLSCSIGFAFYPFLPSRPDLFLGDQVITIADRALYVAKHAGRNAWVGLYSSPTTPTEDVVQRVNNDLATLVRSGAIEISSSRGGAEALLGSAALPDE